MTACIDVDAFARGGAGLGIQPPLGKQIHIAPDRRTSP